MKDKMIIEGSPGHELADTQLAAQLLDKLTKAYPDYVWEVGLNDEDLGGVVTIVNKTINSFILGEPNYGYVLKLSTIYNDPELRCVVRAGGEIIERAYLPRGRYRDEEVHTIDGVDSRRHPMVPGGFYG